MTEKMGNVTIRLSAEKQKKLDDIASSFDRSRNWLINEAVENYLDVFEWQEQRIKDRLKKANKGGKFLSSKRVDNIVDSFKP